MSLSEWRKPDTTFTLKRDFNMTGFLIAAKPDEAFEMVKDGDDLMYKRTDTTSNIVLKSELILPEDDVKRLIEAGRTVLVYNPRTLRLDAYNGDEMALLNAVVAH
ncbi:hypothetical protein [Limosilactobacillus ingluviei]|nr:hypothetical protein [Limosilactobacillus ingluviei]